MRERRVAVILRGCGMREREIADSLLPPLSSIKITLRDGGAGLIGNTGCGKTTILARHLRRVVDGIVAAAPDPEVAMAPFNFAAWLNWPTAAERIKTLSRGDNWTLANLMQDLAECGSLYLDDLGQERVRGEDDLALGHLRMVIDERYRCGRPIFWTSNLTPEEFDATYGARTLSRLFSAYPPVRVHGTDLRMRKAAG